MRIQSKYCSVGLKGWVEISNRSWNGRAKAKARWIVRRRGSRLNNKRWMSAVLEKQEAGGQEGKDAVDQRT